MIVAAAFLILLGVLFAVFGWSERRDDRIMADEEAEDARQRAELEAWFEAESNRDRQMRRTVHDEIRDMSWPQMRAFCEKEVGNECCCATRSEIAKRVYDVRWRRAKNETKR